MREQRFDVVLSEACPLLLSEAGIDQVKLEPCQHCRLAHSRILSYQSSHSGRGAEIANWSTICHEARHAKHCRLSV